MDKIAGYQLLEKRHQTNRTLLYRGRANETNHPVLIKLLIISTSSPAAVTRFHLFYETIKELMLPGVLTVKEIVDTDEFIALIFEDFPGKPLNEHLQTKKISLIETLKIAITLSETIGNLHRHRIIHKGITPDNIFVAPENGQVKLAGFGIDQEITHENDAISNPDIIANNLSYISPEQTGRMNRRVDYETDLYSLGIILYEMLTGKCPFTTGDPLAMLHSHMARKIIPPHAANPAIPVMLSDITEKLLAKTAEERYRSGFGLKADLENCLRDLQQNKQISSFRLAQRDITSRFSISDNMVGRETEISLLMSAFTRVAEGGSEVVLVSGFPGIGKSALIREIHKPITSARGYFIHGKFEKLKQNEPYSALYQAFTQLTRQLLTEPAESISIWRRQLLGALGSNGRIIVDVIPEMEYIIGRQDAVPVLGPEESHNRFILTWKDFIAVFTTSDHPLVIFLDDLQWADASSLTFINHMATGRKTGFLLWICAFRDHNSSTNPWLTKLQSSLQKENSSLTLLELAPLDVDHVNRHLSGVLRCDMNDTQALAGLVHDKTGGNPFFVNQFLKTLYDDHLIQLDSNGKYCWDIKAIRELGITDNVVALLTAKIALFSENTKATLKTCACMGLRFSPETVAAVRKKGLSTIIADLSPALTTGMIDHSKDLYFFTHDRIQEAVYSLLSDEERQRQHHRIGKHLLERTDPNDHHNKIFYIVDQLNSGKKFIRTIADTNELLRLNLNAGKKAKEAAAFEAARTYLRQAQQLLTENDWKNNYAIALDVHMELAVCEHLCQNFGKAERYFDNCLQKARDRIDKATVYNHKLILLANLTRFPEALETGRKGLKLLGVELPENPGQVSIFVTMMKIRLLLKGRKAEDLRKLPVMEEPAALLVIKILMNLTMTAYFLNADLSIIVALKMLEMTLAHGNSAVSPYAYAVYGVALGSGFGDYPNGTRFGEMARQLNHHFQHPELKAKIDLLYGGGICIWTSPISKGLKHLHQAHTAALENGDVNSSIYAIQAIVIQMIAGGKPLGDVAEVCTSQFEFIARAKDPGALNYLLSVRQFIRCLQKQKSDPPRFSDESFDEPAHLQKMTADNIPVIQHRHFLLKMRLFYVLKDYPAALEAGQESKRLLSYSMGQIVVPEHYFYFALTNTAMASLSKGSAKRHFLRQASRCKQKLKKWARNAPENFKHKHLLVEAEIASHTANVQKTLSLYGQAIKSARTNGYIQNEAIGCERAADFYFALGFEDLAATMIRQAHFAYNRWEAHAKVLALEEDFPHLLSGRRHAHLKGEDSASILLSKMDIKTLRLALKTTTEETIHSRMLSKTMRVVIETAGAQKGLLLLRKDSNQMVIEAEGSADTDSVSILQSTPLVSSQNLSHAVVNFVRRTGESIVVHNASRENNNLPQLASDPYIVNNQVQSILCLPIAIGSGSDAEIVGLLYLENNRATGAFTEEIIEMLEIICLAVAGRIELSQKAVTDGLTGLYNHDYFHNVLRHEILLSMRQDHHLSLIMIDIDHFKKFNDSWGHQMGDHVLQLVATTIRNTCRQSDIIARYGGEEIAIILRETEMETAVKLGEKLRKAIEALSIPHPEQNTQPLGVTVSVGVAAFPSHASGHQELIQQADNALYGSKKKGRNQVTAAETR